MYFAYAYFVTLLLFEKEGAMKTDIGKINLDSFLGCSMKPDSIDLKRFTLTWRENDYIHSLLSRYGI